MITALKIFLGWPGTWLWACRQMKEGRTVYRLRDSGIAVFKYDKGQRKIEAKVHWVGATSSQWISMEDMFATDLKILPVNPDYGKLYSQSQMKFTD